MWGTSLAPKLDCALTGQDPKGSYINLPSFSSDTCLIHATSENGDIPRQERSVPGELHPLTANMHRFFTGLHFDHAFPVCLHLLKTCALFFVFNSFVWPNNGFKTGHLHHRAGYGVIAGIRQEEMPQGLSSYMFSENSYGSLACFSIPGARSILV